MTDSASAPAAMGDAAARGVKWKKRWRGRGRGVHGDNTRPAELCALLGRCTLRGALAHGAAWLLADAHAARLLDRLCLGRPARGVTRRGADAAAAAAAAGGGARGAAAAAAVEAEAAAEAAAADGGGDASVAAAAPPQQPHAGGGPTGWRAPQQQLLRLSLLEAMFLAHGLGCLTLYDDEARPRRIRAALQRVRCAALRGACLTCVRPSQAALPPPEALLASAGGGTGAEDAAALARWAPPALAAALGAWRAGGAAPDTLAPILLPPQQRAPPAAAAASAAAAAAPRDATPARSDAAAEAAAAQQQQQQPAAVAAAAGAAGQLLRALSDAQLWRACVDAQPGFAAAYAAYLYCRARGWLVRSRRSGAAAAFTRADAR